MKRNLLILPMLALLLGIPISGNAADTALQEPEVLRFEIISYTLDGATLLSKEDVDAAVAPYLGKSKDFSDVQGALEAIEELYADRGYTAVRVLLPEQELENGRVRFRVVESRFGKVEIKDNHFVTEANVMNALPSIRSGGVPRSSQIARELKLANENPARQLNAILKAGAKDDEVDARVIVTDSDPAKWSAWLDNTGSADTGFTRLGVAYRHANLFDKDHVASLQYVTSPQHADRVKVMSASYKIPLYESGNSMEYSVGYSKVNAKLPGNSNFEGGGVMIGARYNFLLERSGRFDPRITLGLDRKNFKQIRLIGSPSFYNEIVVLPVSVAYATQGKFETSDLNFNISLSANIPSMDKGKTTDFDTYDQLNNTKPNPNYKVVRYSGSYAQAIGESGGQFRAALNGQWSKDVLIQGEQMRLGGSDGIRGFSEGSEGGETTARLNIEGYTPEFAWGSYGLRALVFYDIGQAKPTNGVATVIKSAGAGLRASYTEQVSLRLDWAQIKTAGTDIGQQAGDWRWHASLNASY